MFSITLSHLSREGKGVRNKIWIRAVYMMDKGFLQGVRAVSARTY
jgi:hypothetical protein